jgi:hypothetical protein
MKLTLTDERLFKKKIPETIFILSLCWNIVDTLLEISGLEMFLLFYCNTVSPTNNGYGPYYEFYSLNTT